MFLADNNRYRRTQLMMFIVQIGISLTTCFGRSRPSSSNTYVELYQQELLDFKLFELK